MSSLQFGLVVEQPDDSPAYSMTGSREMDFKTFWLLTRNIFIHKTEENNKTTDEYCFNLLDLQEGDLVGLKVSDTGQLYFTYNGVELSKVADSIPTDAKVALNLRQRHPFVSIVSPNNSVSVRHRERYTQQLQRHNAKSMMLLQFHANRCGTEIELYRDQRTARRRNPVLEFRNAVVVTSKPLPLETLFQLRIAGVVDKWNGSIEFGLTLHDPDISSLPATLTNLRAGTLVLSGNSILTNGHSNPNPYVDGNLDDLKIGDCIGVRRKANGDVHFCINGMDLGLAGNIEVHKKVWVIADLYGKTIRVSITESSEDNLHTPTYVPEKLLVESPDELTFNTSCGSNVQLSDLFRIARRKNDLEFNNGIVFTNRPLRVGETFSVKLVRCINQWAGNLELGITNIKPNNFEFPLTMTDVAVGYNVMLTSNGLIVNGCALTQSSSDMGGRCPALRDDHRDLHSVLLTGLPCLSTGCILGVQLLRPNRLQFFINGADLGVITLQESLSELYGVVDLYGKAAEVRLCEQQSINESLLEERSGADGAEGLTEEDDEEEEETAQSTDYEELAALRAADSLETADESFLRLLSNEIYGSPEGHEDIGRELVFHMLHGPNVNVSYDGKEAHRPLPNNEFKNALVMSSRRLRSDELFEISLDSLTDLWSGSLEIGVTLAGPDELDFPATLSQIDNSCWVLSGSSLLHNGLTTQSFYGLDTDALRLHSRIGVVQRSNGNVHFYLNGRDMGIAFNIVPHGVYAIVDLYGKCSQISVTRDCGRRAEELSDRNAEMGTVAGSHDDVSPGSQSHDLSDAGRLRAIKDFISAINCEAKTQEPIDLESNNAASESSAIPQHRQRDDSSSQRESVLRQGNLFHQLVCGMGIQRGSDDYFFAENESGNCVIQSSLPVEPSVYHEIVLHHEDTVGRRSDQPFTINPRPPSLGFITDKFASNRYLPDDLFRFSAPSWILSWGSLFLDKTLYVDRFAPDLVRFKSSLTIGLYLYEFGCLEIFIDGRSTGNLISDLPRTFYLVVNLRGWYTKMRCSSHSVSSTRLDLRQLPMATLIPNSQLANEHIYKPEKKNSDTDKETNKDNTTVESTPITTELCRMLPSFVSVLVDSASVRSLLLSSSSVGFWLSSSSSPSSLLLERIVHSERDLVATVRRQLDRLRQVGYCVAGQDSVQRLLLQELCWRLAGSIMDQGRGDSVNQFQSSSRSQLCRQLLRHVQLDLWHSAGSGTGTTRLPGDESGQMFLPAPGSTVRVTKEGCAEGGAQQQGDEGSRLAAGTVIVEATEEQDSPARLGYVLQVMSTATCTGLSLQMQFQARKPVCGPVLGFMFVAESVLSCTRDLIACLQHLPCPRHLQSLHLHMCSMLTVDPNAEPPVVVGWLHDDQDEPGSSFLILNGRRFRKSLPVSLDSILTGQHRIAWQLQLATNWRLMLHMNPMENGGSSNPTQVTVLDKQQLDSALPLHGHITDPHRQKQQWHFLVVPLLWLPNGLSVQLSKSSDWDVAVRGSSDTHHRRQTRPQRSVEKHLYEDSELAKESSRGTITGGSGNTTASGQSECTAVFRAGLLRSRRLALPDPYFCQTPLCYCRLCRSQASEAALLNAASGTINDRVESLASEQDVYLKGEPARQFRLPLGWVKFSIRLRKEHRVFLMMWHLAYLTVPYGFIHNLLSSSDPLCHLQRCLRQQHTNFRLAWMQPPDPATAIANQEVTSKVAVSPWQPLPGCVVGKDNHIEPLEDCFVPGWNGEPGAMVSLEVRLRPGSYNSSSSNKSSSKASKASLLLGSDDVSPEDSGRISSRSVWLLYDLASNCGAAAVVGDCQPAPPVNLVVSGLLLRPS